MSNKRKKTKRVPRKLVTVDELRAFYRFEIGSDALFVAKYPECEYVVKENCIITLDDVVAALHNMRDRDMTVKQLADWNEELEWNADLEGAYISISEDEDEASWDSDKGIDEAPETEAEFIRSVERCWSEAVNAWMCGELDANVTAFMDYELVLADIERFRAGNGSGVLPYLWSKTLRKEYALGITDAMLGELGPEKLKRYRAVLDGLCDEGDPQALARRAYAYYEGNPAYEQGWVAARADLLALMDNDQVDDRDKGRYANSLGYIYYYDYCGDGTPDYEKAYHYYTIGLHAGAMYESAYKLADLYLSGKGGVKNKWAAYHMVKWTYDHCLEDFCSGGWKNVGDKFADAALRMGDYTRDGICVPQDHETAYCYYTQAAFAIAKRQKAGSYIGDVSVAARIKDRIDAMREEFPDAAPSKWGQESLPDDLAMAYAFDYMVKIDLERIGKNIRLTARRLPKDGCMLAPKILVTHPRYGYCKLCDKLVLDVRGVTSVELFKGDKAFEKTGKASIRTSWIRCSPKWGPDDAAMIDFIYANKVVGTIAFDHFRFRVDNGF